MRRTILTGALLVALATSCTPADNTNANANRAPANTGANANAAAAPSPTQADSSAELIERERQLYDAVRRKDWDAFGRFLADTQLYITGNGVHDRAKTIEMVKNLDITDFSMTDTRVVNVTRDLAVVTYTSHTKGTYAGRPIRDESVRESTAWVNRGGTWLAVYHQDSVVETPRPPSAAANRTPPDSEVQTRRTPTPTPMMTDALTATDVERQIWDALRRKDWDTFAALLADDAVEVEPTGVHDKQGSVSMVRQFDFSGVTLSDVREEKLTPDAALVTYVVRGPAPAFGPRGQRHTTILANRGGRWLAVFHQGTPIRQ